MLLGINVGLGLINISSGLSLICSGKTEADSSGTHDYFTYFSSCCTTNRWLLSMFTSSSFSSSVTYIAASPLL